MKLTASQLSTTLALALLVTSCGSAPKRSTPQSGGGSNVEAGTVKPSDGTTNTPNTDPSKTNPSTDPFSPSLPDVPFEPLTPFAYVSKVKTLLSGQAVTDDEIKVVQADPKALTDLVDKWTASAEFKTKQMAFFRLAFQQNGLQRTSFDAQSRDGYGMDSRIAAFDNAMESFSRTAWDIVEKNQAFTNVITTRSYMMTPALLSVLTYFDSLQVDDNGNVSSYDEQKGVKFRITHDGLTATTPLEDAVKSNPVQFYMPCAKPAYDIGYLDLSRYLWGEVLDSNRACEGFKRVFTDKDFNDWRLVTFRQAKGTEARTRFYDFTALRTANEIVLATPRLGFFTTPAFFGNWFTNDSNQGRVTANQTLIVALGGAFNPGDLTIPLETTSIPDEHSTPGTICYACHKGLDPMRSYFRNSYSLYYGPQKNPNWIQKETGKPETAKASFAWNGVTGAGETLYDFAELLAKHPDFAPAWTQKLCYYANSMPCDETDPEFIRVASAFSASKFNYKVLIRELFTSPLVTGSQVVKTYKKVPVPISISRSNHFCVSLESRLQVNDPCGLNLGIIQQPSNYAFQLSASIPGDFFSRGSPNVTPPTNPSLFTRAGSEAICSEVARKVVTDDNTLFPVKDSAKATTKLIATVMGLTAPDARTAEALKMFNDYFTEAKTIKNVSATDIMRSAFILACTSPTSVAIGL